MKSTETRPPVPGSSAIPGACSGQGNSGAGGAKNPRKRSRGRGPATLESGNLLYYREGDRGNSPKVVSGFSFTNLGYGQRNPRGQRLADFLEKEELFMMNSFFQKPPHRKWTWLSPDGFTRNEIDFFMTDKKRVFSDVSVINRVKTGSDHRIVS
nr:craniofacial development protein 2-like [Helicoverpa armigera]